MTEISFKELKAKSKIKLGNNPIKLAVLSDTTCQFLDIALRGYSVIENLDLSTFIGGHGQVEQLLLDPDSELLIFKPDYILIYLASINLQNQFYKIEDFNERENFSEKCHERIKSLIGVISKNLKISILCANFPEINDGVYGSYANKIFSSFIFQIRKLNLELSILASEKNNLHILDLSSILNFHGRKHSVDSKLLVNGGVELNFQILPYVAQEVVNIINASRGKVKKCLILDLDNTLWGGVIGDDGIGGVHLGGLGIGKAFVDFQNWIKELKRKGILLAVCSKNEEQIAKSPFLSHPDMVLDLDDIAIFVANWNNKVDNIKFIQTVLNIGFDSMVFIDDNPVEREWVKKQLPEIVVPDLPVDPADYLGFLQVQNLFETTGISKLDRNRTKQYQDETKRRIYKEEFGSFKDYLDSLLMEASIEELSEFNLPRVAQLFQRSNQFNFRTIRYSESDLISIKNNPNYFIFCVHLKDKFGDYGLISAVVLSKKANTFFIENWVMSCRVFNRGVEDFVLSEMIFLAKNNKVENLVGEYIPTIKNKVVSNFFEENGFERNKSKWWFAVSNYKNKQTTIKYKAKTTENDGVSR